MELEAIYMQGDKLWLVRPKGQLGSMGWHPYAWSVIRVRAFTAEGAIKRALPIAAKQRMRLYGKSAAAV